MDWKKWNDQKCNVMTSTMENCADCAEIDDCCKYQSWFCKIPYFIIDQMQEKLSSSAFRVFIYLNRRADFTPTNDHYGMCWVNYKDIEEATTVKRSNMWKYVKELEAHNFITHKVVVQKDGDGYKSTNIFTICWIKQLVSLKKFATKSEA